jgi:hypothetical protein
MPARSPRNRSPLPSSSLAATDRIDVGSRFATEPLVSHARAVLEKLPSYPFAAYGFDAAWTRAFESLLDAIDSQLAQLDASHEAALPTGAALDGAVEAAKNWRREALAVVAILPGANPHALPKTSGSSAAGLAASLKKLVPRVSAARVTPHGDGRAMSRRGRELLTALDRARVAHRKSLARLSPEAKALHAAKGTLYEELKRIARVARHIAPSEGALCAVGSHVRVGHHHRRSHVTPTAAGAATAPTTAG